MDTSSNYYVWIHPRLKKEDLPNLPDELQKQFERLFLKVLTVDPHKRRGLPGHFLERELLGYQTIDIKYLGEQYRLIYWIDTRPQAMKVYVYAFDRHDPAYDKAKDRVPR